MLYEQLEVRRLLTGDVRVRFEFTDLAENPLSSLHVNQDFLLRVHIQDIRDSPAGVFQAYLDVNYNAQLLSTIGSVIAGEDFQALAYGSTLVAGIIDEAGGIDSNQVPPEFAGTELILFSVPFRAVAVGTVTLTADLAEGPAKKIILFDSVSGVDLSHIDFVGGQIEITDIPTPQVSIEVSNHGSETGPTNGSFKFNQSITSDTNTIISYTVGGTADPESDYDSLNGQVTIPAGQQSAEINVIVNNDSIVECNEQVVVTLTGVSGDPDVSINPTANEATLTIADNDTAVVGIEAVANGDEDGLSSGSFLVTQTKASSIDTVVAYSVGGTATSGTDFTALDGSVLIPAGQTTATIQVPVRDDELIEGTETVIVTLGSITSGHQALITVDPSNSTATVNIADDDTALVRIARSQDGAEAGSASGRFTVSLTAAVPWNVEVSYSVSGSATSGIDFTALDKKITIPAGETSATIDVAVINDALVEATETVSVTVTSVTGGGEQVLIDASSDSATIDITDNDSALVRIEATADGNEDGPTNGRFIVSMTAASSTNTVVNYSTSGSATAGQDYIALSNNVTILAGQTSATINVVTQDDSDTEGTETVLVTLSSITGDPQITVDSANNQATINILDDERTGVSIARTQDGAEDGLVSGLFTVSQNRPTDTDTVIRYRVSGTATSDTDYTQIGDRLTIAAGETSATIDVAVRDDALLEGDETVIVTLEEILSGDALLEIDANSRIATMQVEDDETGLIRIENTADGDEAAPIHGQFTVTQDGIATVDTVINFAIAGSAVEGNDYVSPGVTVTIAAGQTSATIDLDVINDALVEATETIGITLGSIASGSPLVLIDASSKTATLQIADNDSAQVSIAATTDGNEEGPTSGLFTVSQTAASSSDTVLSYTVGGTATAGQDYTALSGDVTILAGQTTATISVPMRDDDETEGLETVIVTLTSRTAGDPQISIDPADNEAVVRILDNERTGVGIDPTRDGAEDGLVSGVFTVSQNLPTDTDTVVRYTVSGTATSGSDYTLLTDTVTISAGTISSTIEIPILDDSDLEGDESITITLAAIESGDEQLEIDPSAETATIDIVDDETGLVQIVATSDGDEAGPVHGILTITQDGLTSGDTVIEYSVLGTATEGTDYADLTGTVTILSGETSATIDIDVTNDDLVEPTESLIVTLNSLTNSNPLVQIDPDNDSATIQISDNDSAQVSIMAVTDGSEAGSASGQFLVSMTAASSTDTEIHITVGGSATTGDDYTALASPVIIAAGETSATIDVAVNDDGTVEPAETVTITLDSLSSASDLVTIDANNALASLEISDNDSAVVRLSKEADGSEAGPENGAFTVSLTAPSSLDTVLSYSVGGTATPGADFEQLDATITIAAGEVLTQIDVVVIGDEVLEGTELVTVTLDGITSGNDQIAIDAGNNIAEVEIIDDETGLVSISTTQNGSEAGSISGLFTVLQNGTTTTNTVIDYTVTGSATMNDDFQDLIGQVTIPAGASSATIDVLVNDDLWIEGDETVTITLDSISQGDTRLQIDPVGQSATLTIEEDDTGLVSIAMTANANEAGETAGAFTVSQSGQSQLDTVIAYSVTGTATSGSDFADFGSSVTIAAGDTSARIDVPVFDDSIVESTETIVVTLTTISSGAAEIMIDSAQNSATVEIVDDDSAVVTVSATSDGDETGPVNARFTVSQSAESSTDTVLVYSLSGMATSGSDFSTPIGSVTIPAGQTSGMIDILLTNDADVEGTETLAIALESRSAGNTDISIDQGQATATLEIEDNDVAMIGFGAAESSTFEIAQTHAIDIVLSIPSGGSLERPVTVSITDTGQGSATAGQDYTLITTSATFTAGSQDGDTRSVELTLVDDGELEDDDETVELQLQLVDDGTSGQVSLSTTTTHVVTIVDDPMTASLSGVVWADTNNNGVVDASELRLPGVKIQLRGEDLQGRTVEAVTMTGDDGSYELADLPGGTYSILQDQPRAFIDGDEVLGTVQGQATGQISDDRFTEIVLPIAQQGINYNFAERGLLPQYISRRMFLASSPPMQQVVRDVIAQAEAQEGDAHFAQVIRQGEMVEMQRIGADVKITGTSGNDTVSFVPAGSSSLATSSEHMIVANGMTWYFVSTDVDTFAFDGKDGTDHIELHDSAGDDMLVAAHDALILESDDFRLDATDFEFVRAVAESGGDNTVDEDLLDFALELVGDWHQLDED